MLRNRDTETKIHLRRAKDMRDPFYKNRTLSFYHKNRERDARALQEMVRQSITTFMSTNHGD